MAEEDKEHKSDPKNVQTLQPPREPPKDSLKDSMNVKCGGCNKTVQTELVHQNGHCAYISALFFCSCFLCCIPLCPGVDACKDVHHICPECGVKLGTFQKHYWQDI